MSGFDLKFYMSLFWRHVPLFAMIVAFVSAIGIAVAFLLPATYTARALILVQSQQIPGELAQTTVTVGADEQIQVIRQRLLTRANLLDIADSFRVFEGNSSLSPTEIVQEMLDSTTLQPVVFGDARRGGVTALQVAFSGKSPVLAAEIANEFVTRILSENARLRTVTAEETREFFEKRAQELSRDLARLEGEILTFKANNSEALPDSLDFRRTRQLALQERKVALQREEQQINAEIARLEEFREDPSLLPREQIARTPDEEQLAELKRQLTQSLAIYSERHPNVVGLKARIAGLEASISDEAARLASPNDPFAGQANRTPEQIRLDQEIALRRDRLAVLVDDIARIDQGIADLETSIAATPGNESALAVLQREYENIEKQYNEAQAALATAATGEVIEAGNKGQRFELIENATPPEDPDSPNRIMLAIASVAGGIAIGGAVVALLELMNRSIRRPVDLVNRLEITPFATVPYVRLATEARNKRLLLLFAVAAIGLAVPAILVAVHYYYQPVDLILDRLVDRLGISGFLKKFN